MWPTSSTTGWWQTRLQRRWPEDWGVIPRHLLLPAGLAPPGTATARLPRLDHIHGSIPRPPVSHWQPRGKDSPGFPYLSPAQPGAGAACKIPLGFHSTLPKSSYGKNSSNRVEGDARPPPQFLTTSALGGHSPYKLVSLQGKLPPLLVVGRAAGHAPCWWPDRDRSAVFGCTGPAPLCPRTQPNPRHQAVPYRAGAGTQRRQGKG